MIHSRKVLEKFLNLLLVFLIPTQLAFHFWPKFAFVFGIRVDYLAPTIYLTDILFTALFVFWLIKVKGQIILNEIRKKKLLLIGLLLIAILNIIFSSSATTSLLKWLKIFEVGVFAFYVWARKDIFNNKSFYLTLFASLVFFSLIGILQVTNGGTLNGPFYYLGERNFNILTPGIALNNFLNIVLLRPYSTFPHPNALAGYLAVGMFLFSIATVKRGLVIKFGVIIVFVSYVLTSSLSSLVGLIVCGLVYLIFKKGFFNKKILSLTVMFSFAFSLLFSVFSISIDMTKINFNQNIEQRIELANIAGKLISKNFIIGIGLNTFIPNEVLFSSTSSNVWLLQPVHNIYLLVISEVGIIGGLILYFMFYKILKENTKFNHVVCFLAFIFIMTVGLFDHYWFTLQQNLLLLGLLIGNSLKSKA